MASLETLSKTLDVFGGKVGMILVRHADYWRSLEPGEDGYVLTTHGYKQPPTWEPATAPTSAPGLFSAGTFDPQGSLAVTYTWPDGTVTMKWHMSAQNYVSINVPRPGNCYKVKLGTLLRFPSTAAGNVMLYWKCVGWRPNQTIPTPTEHTLAISSPGANQYVWYYSNEMEFPVDAQYIGLQWGRRGDLSGDSYGDYVYASMFSVEYLS